MQKFLFLFLSIIISLDLHAKSCQENRMGLDIGSGSTKMLVAEVDTCKKQIIKVLLSESRPVGYNDDFEKSKDQTISAEMEAKGLKTLQDLIALSKSHKVKSTKGVATSVFRKAKNGKEIIARFAKKLKLNLKVISQEEEAMLGYASAVSTIPDPVEPIDPKKTLVVWDIGGGSMQMIAKKGKETHVYLGNLASVSFKNMVMEVLQLKNIESAGSPNPIGLSRPNAIAMARSYARLHVPAFFFNKNRDLEFLGVGGVHGASIKNQLQLKEKEYSLRELEDKAIQQAQKGDADLAGDYKATDVTNLLLVQGFMEALGIREVKIAEASLLQGLLLQ